MSEKKKKKKRKEDGKVHISSCHDSSSS